MRNFIRKMMFSAVVSSCILFGILGVFVVYENTREVGFADNTNAVEITEYGIRILDFEFKF